MLYAVTLVGVPGRIINGVIDALRSRFTDQHVFRGIGVRLTESQLTMYDDDVVAGGLRMAADAVFGKSKRPVGFCRHAARPCALRSARKGSCEKAETQSCALSRPDFLIVIYQEGLNEKLLEEKLHYSAYTTKLPKTCYNHQSRTIEAVIAALKTASRTLGLISASLTSVRTPLLLPALNFGAKDVIPLLREALKDGGKSYVEQFRRSHYQKKSLAYQGRNGLRFEPTTTEGRHGIADVKDQVEIALSRAYRLGAPYPRDFHYDVGKKDGGEMGGKVRFFCRENGPQWPHGRHANITVDDCILG